MKVIPNWLYSHGNIIWISEEIWNIFIILNIEKNTPLKNLPTNLEEPFLNPFWQISTLRWMKIWLLSFCCSSYLTICGKNQSHSEVVFYYVPYVTDCRRLQSWPWKNYSEIVTKTCLEPRKQEKYSEAALWSTLKSCHRYSSCFLSVVLFVYTVIVAVYSNRGVGNLSHFFIIHSLEWKMADFQSPFHFLNVTRTFLAL